MLLDGDDLPALMQRVRTEMGPDAVVVKAERVRTGGVAGFFAKEHFEVTVEIPDGPTRPAAARPAAVGMSALLDAADAADLGGGATGPAGPATTSPPTRSSAATPHAVPAAPASPGARPVGGPRVSTDGDSFATLLASIDGMAQAPRDPAAPPVPSPRTERPGAPGVPAGAGRDAADPTAGEEPAGDKPPIPAARFAPQGATVTAATFAPLDASTPVAAPAPAGPSTATPHSAPAAGAPAAAVSAAAPAPATSAQATSAPVAPTVVLPSVPTPHPPGGGDRRALLGLGVPASVLGAGPLDEPLPLSRLLGALPRPPMPLRAEGSVVVVVGEGSQALPVATQLAQRARLNAQDVVLAGAIEAVAGHGRRLLSPVAAARHRAKLTETDPVSIVALGVGPDSEDWSAAAGLLAALEPDQCWAAVDARRKAADLRAWMRAIGGTRAFDVVAAAWVHETQEPGTVLDLGAPVGWLDGLPATPVVWAAVLSERLDADARWD
ncbi:hypothetical protein CAE01nite_22250 [Cellulomonas aerilata]|uniref:Uncharacterized protein n=1 Tax=Cellulomonas aerilata TaxID=515326 RepID=A0A512DE45_9CELL|nr:hypothetical protein CAE01nite_22250 [Cellulomonas aerilata]